MRLVLRRRAKLDLLEARRWYDARQQGLGDSLLEEVTATLELLQEHPEIHPRVDDRVRRAGLRRFPYGIFYIVGSEAVRVIAILHNARNPEHWRLRRE